MDAYIIIYSIISIILIITVWYIVYRILNSKSQSPTEFISLLSILSSQIKTELDAYDQDIFEVKGSITNNNYDRYYKDLTNRIIQNISPDMVKELTKYYTEDAVYKYIARSVRDYLTTKINGTL